MTKTAKILMTILFVVSAFNVFAFPISVEQASQYAQKFYRIQKGIVANPEIKDVKVLDYQGMNTIALFSFGKDGFVAMSLDDAFTPVLAYSFKASDNLDEFPPAAVMWLDYLSQNIYLKISGFDSVYPVNELWKSLDEDTYPQQSSKAALLSTPEWGQGCYYNTMCPVDGLGQCGHAATGCTATAMAEIMKFWEHPQFGSGSHSYESQWYGILSADFGATEYVWAEMPAQPTEENAALATLMYHCGVSVSMAYTGTTSSAAITPYAFVDYFGYSPNARYEYQSSYSWPEWVSLLKSEIDNGRPVLYAGWEPMLIMGHAFVCDGYDDSDYLHFNWGDNGSGNGYFLMPEITFPANNMIVCNLYPNPDCDITVTDIYAPISHTFTTPSIIGITVKNFGAEEAADIPVCYSVNGGTPVCQTIPVTLQPGEEYQFEFFGSYDFSVSPGATFNLLAYSDYSCDLISENDTAFLELLNVSCAEIPYSTGFAIGEERDGWLVAEDVIDGNLWQFQDFGDAGAFYQGNTNYAHDWLFSRCLELEEGSLYKLTFDYKSTGLFWPQNLEVHFGPSPDSDYMGRDLCEIEGFTNNEFQTSENYFIVDNTGSWYFGFYCNSQPEMLNLVIDNFNLTKMSGTDLAMTQILAPSSGCDIGNELVEVELRNMCSQVLSNFDICYKLDDNEPVVFTYTGDLIPGYYLNHSFETLADFSVPGEHNLTAFVVLDGDENLSNDTLYLTLNNSASAHAPYYCGFDAPEDYENWVIENTNADNRTWQYVGSGGVGGSGCARYEYNDFNAADDWLFTKCFYLDGSWVYKMTFKVRIEDATWPENLEVAIADNPSSGAVVMVLNDFPDLLNTEWVEKTVYFDGPEGYMHLGFHCYSDAQMFNLYIDDVLIVEDTQNYFETSDKSEFEIYPNPAFEELRIVIHNNSYDECKITISDLSGKTVITKDRFDFNQSLNISHLQSGVYFISLSSANGNICKRFVKI